MLTSKILTSYPFENFSEGKAACSWYQNVTVVNKFLLKRLFMEFWNASLILSITL